MLPNPNLPLKNVFPPKLLESSRSVFRQELYINLLEIPVLVQQFDEHPELLHTLLTSKEYETYQSYRLDKRKNEYLSGRIAAKLSLIQQFQTKNETIHCRDIEIGNAPSGRPYVNMRGKKNSPSELSISHSGKYALAIAAYSPCGVDIQSTETTLAKVKDRYCTAEEESVLTSRTCSLQQLALLWAAKEALKKSYSRHGEMPGFLDTILVDAQSVSPDIQQLTFTMKTGHKAQVITSAIDTYGLAVTISPKKHHA